MEENQKLLVLKEDHEFNYKAFRKWRRKNDFDIAYISQFYTNFFVPEVAEFEAE